ncbi:MAG: AMP-binding protein [Pseudomonadota bacterium]
MMSQPAIPDYASFTADFDIAQIEAMLDGSLTEGLNVAHECVDRWADGDRVAANWIAANGDNGELTFADLKRRSAQFANILAANGVGPGDVVSGLLPRIPELLVVIMGTMRAGAVYQPLFTAFGPKAIEHRLKVSNAKMVVSDAANRSKLDGITEARLVATIGASQPGDIDFGAALDEQSEAFDPVMRTSADLFLMMSTSGTTGAPKGVPIPQKALLSFIVYMRYGLGLREGDRYWNIADPGWAYGLFYVVFGPLLLGHTTTLVDGPFSVEGACEVIEGQDITNLAGAPTAYRMMIAAGDGVPNAIRGQLRVASSAGEPLNPEVVRWFDEKLDCPLKDHYGQTETAMVLFNHHGLSHPVRSGSAGLPAPGITLAVVDEAGRKLPPGEQGILAVDLPNSPLNYFTGYLGREGQDWVGDYYLTGDSVEQHEDGTFSFVGRSDDVISSAGYRIGPFDVESALIEHETVLESAVVGKPDAERGHIVKAFIVLNEGFAASDELSETLRLHVRARLGAHAYPREIEFAEGLPKTPSGKIQRFLLREQA